MRNRRLSLPVTMILLLTASLAGIIAQVPARLTDQEFWKLVTDFSEPDGIFHSENLVSNELRFQTVVPALVEKRIEGRPYVGVGSEQNFTYIAALRPSMAFIVDIRRGNLNLHLIYKTLFELSADRADFVSRLFSRKRPAGLNLSSTAAQLFDAYANVSPNPALHERNLKQIKAHLTSTHGFKLNARDLEDIDFVYASWFASGPEIRYELNTGGFGRARRGGGLGRSGPEGLPTYADLMTATDGEGRNWSYLSNEEAFRIVKDLQTRNLVVPVVGNFAGTRALRSVARYLKQKGTPISAFYVSNVEQYLREDGIWDRFCSNAAAMPADEKSTFIRSARGGFRGQFPGFSGPGFTVSLAPITTAC